MRRVAPTRTIICAPSIPRTARRLLVAWGVLAVAASGTSGIAGNPASASPLPTQLPAQVAVADGSGLRKVDIDDEGRWVVPAERLGGSATLPLDGADPVELNVQIPPGLRPVAVTATFDSGNLAAGGTLTALVGGRPGTGTATNAARTATVVREVGATRAVGPIRLALPDAVAAAGGESGESLTVSWSAQPGPLPCLAGGPSQAPELRDLAVVMEGDDVAPSTLAGFLAPWTERVEILLPDAGPSVDHQDVAEAALRIAAGVTHQLREPGVTIDVHAGQPSGLLSPFTRVITIGPGDTSLLALETMTGRTVLAVRGPVGGLGAVADLPGSPALAQAAVPTLVVQRARDGGAAPSTATASEGTGEAAGIPEAPVRRTLADLDLRSVTRRGPGVAQVGLFGLVPDLGAVPASVQLQVAGQVGLEGAPHRIRVDLLAGSRRVATQTLSPGEALDLSGSAPGTGQGSTTPYVVRATVLGAPVGSCGLLPRVTLTVDGATSVLATAGGTSTDGFDAFPQSLRSRLDVAFGDAAMTADDPLGTAAITAAVGVVAQLQQAALPRLAVRLVGWPESSAGTASLEQRPGTLLVAPSSSQELALRPPLGLSPLTIDLGTVTGSDGSKLVARGDGASLAAVEVLSRGRARHLLLTTGGATALLARLGEQLQSRPLAWPGLHGRVLLSDGQRLTTLQADGSGSITDAGTPGASATLDAAGAAPGSDGGGRPAFWIGAALAAVLVVLVTAVRRLVGRLR